MMSQSVISRYRIKFRFIVNRENCYLSNLGLVVLFISAEYVTPVYAGWKVKVHD